jgi:hypothetical protein
VPEFRGLPSHRLIDTYLIERISQVLHCPEYMGHLHGVLVHNSSEVVHRSAIGLEDDEVAPLRHVLLLMAADQVDERQGVIRDTKPYDRLSSFRLQPGAVCSAQVPALSGIPGRLTGSQRRFALLLKLGGAAVAVIGLAL